MPGTSWKRSYRTVAGLLASALTLAVTPTLSRADPPQTGAQLYLNVSGNKLDDKLDAATSSDPSMGQTGLGQGGPGQGGLSQISMPGDPASANHSKQVDLGAARVVETVEQGVDLGGAGHRRSWCGESGG